MSNITVEQRNAQKLHNLLNIANLNLKNRDIYFFIKCNIKVRLNKLPLPSQDLEILTGHMNAFSNELKTANWNLGKFDAKKYVQFLNDLFGKIDFRKVDTDFLFKCRDLLEISPIKDDLYKRRMEFFDKRLPKIGANTIIQNNNNNNITYTNFVNNAANVNNNENKINQNLPVNPFANINSITNIVQNTTTNNGMPINPFAGMNENSNPYNNMTFESSPFSQNNGNNYVNNNNQNDILRSIPKTGLNNNINNNNNNNNINIEPFKPKQIPEDIKTKIIKELQAISGDIYNGKIENCRYHSIEALLYFKQIFPD